MIYRDRDNNNQVTYILPGFEGELNNVCEDIDEKLKLQIVEKITEVVNTDFYYDMLDDLTDEVNEDFPNNEISKDEIFDIVDLYMDWSWWYR
jgi:hypothetical protein